MSLSFGWRVIFPSQHVSKNGWIHGNMYAEHEIHKLSCNDKESQRLRPRTTENTTTLSCVAGNETPKESERW